MRPIIGSAHIALPEGVGADEVPAWLVVGVKIDLKGKDTDLNPGEDLGQTNLFEEGIGDLSQRDLLESFSRHFLVWIHTWNDNGFKPVHENWQGRAEKRNEDISIEHEGKSHAGTFVGLDDDGKPAVEKTSDGDMLALDVRDFTGS